MIVVAAPFRKAIGKKKGGVLKVESKPPGDSKSNPGTRRAPHVGELVPHASSSYSRRAQNMGAWGVAICPDGKWRGGGGSSAHCVSSLSLPELLNQEKNCREIACIDSPTRVSVGWALALHRTAHAKDY